MVLAAVPARAARRARTIARRYLGEPLDDRVPAEAGQEGVEAGDLDAAVDGPVRLQPPEEVLRLVRPGLPHDLYGGELHGLVLVHVAGERVADYELSRGDQGGHRERNQETEPVVPISSAPQPPDRVHAGDQEARRHVGSPDHVQELGPDERREDDLADLDRGRVALTVEREALRRVHPGVHRKDGEGPDEGDDRQCPPPPCLGETFVGHVGQTRAGEDAARNDGKRARHGSGGARPS